MNDETPTQTPINPPPAEIALAIYIVRETVAVVFVLFWMALFAGELVTGRYVVPFWLHCCAIGVLGFALGLGVGQLLAYQAPTPAGVARGVVRRHREEEGEAG